MTGTTSRTPTAVARAGGSEDHLKTGSSMIIHERTDTANRYLATQAPDPAALPTDLRRIWHAGYSHGYEAAFHDAWKLAGRGGVAA